MKTRMNLNSDVHALCTVRLETISSEFRHLNLLVWMAPSVIIGKVEAHLVYSLFELVYTEMLGKDESCTQSS